MDTSPIFPPDPRPGFRTPPLDARSRALRRVILETFQAGGRGHLGSAFSLVEMLRVLYDQVLAFDPARPRWSGRDRMILSKGHGCLARLDRNPARVFVIDSDGECDEGSLWEAALSASKHGLDNLTVLLDYNHMQSYSGTSEVLELEPLADKWRAFGFQVREADGHDPAALADGLGTLPFRAGRPSILICHTVKGKGLAQLEGNPKWHHKSNVSSEELAALFAELEQA
jgi:transketolase N-terminal domain/subunit